jgi:hypothetical protein
MEWGKHRGPAERRRMKLMEYNSMNACTECNMQGHKLRQCPRVPAEFQRGTHQLARLNNLARRMTLEEPPQQQQQHHGTPFEEEGDRRVRLNYHQHGGGRHRGGRGGGRGPRGRGRFGKRKYEEYQADQDHYDGDYYRSPPRHRGRGRDGDRR